MRRLIVNADDFGLTPGVNRAIVEAHRNGIVTSSTLMATGAAFDDAAKDASSLPDLAIGCHVLLVDAKPVLQPEVVSDLIEPSSSSHFRETLGSFARQTISGKISSEQIEAETIAQIRKLQSANIGVSHIDSHKHTHILPQVLRPLLRAAKACNVKAVRNPFGPLRISLLSGHLELWRQYGKVSLLKWLAGWFNSEVSKAGMATPDGTIGIVTTGFLTQDLLNRMLETLPEGTWELVCHPGYNDADLDKVKTRLRSSRAAELEILTSDETRQLLAKNQIDLINYRDLG
ncbi:MAG TPA: ChbG/HpnK family deacetylase [Terriglobales bacterium]